MRMRIAVCDDQPEVLDAVAHMLENTGIASEDSVAVYSDIRHLKEIFQEEELPDVLLWISVMKKIVNFLLRKNIRRELNAHMN